MDTITKQSHPELYTGKKTISAKDRLMAKLYKKTGWRIFRYPKKAK